jgi:arylsulfatase A-like enzyme
VAAEEEERVKAVFVLFDSLNRHLLSPYGGTRIDTPNFARLATRGMTFDRHYVGSMPCIPARRDMQTGRLSFLHRSWGPLEPYDNSFPELLFEAGIYSHLVTDHNHYFEDGGATYHTRYDSFDFIRGQEGDGWKAMVQPPWERLRELYHERQFSSKRRTIFSRHIINREWIREEEDFPSYQVFAKGLEFLDINRTADGWLLQIETFDPHEPFYAPARFREKFKSGWNGPIRDWPRYGRVDELPAECEELRANYYALVAFCDDLMGRLLDYFDRHDLWKDTALVVTTDHGFLLGEHDFWAKNRMNMYEELAHIPLFAWHPDWAAKAGTRRGEITQTMDICPTFLEMFGAAVPPEVQGLSLFPRPGAVPRTGALFGYFGGAINLTDGRYTYHRYPKDLAAQDIFQYTVMPTHLRDMFRPEELRLATLAPPFPFTKGVPLLKVPVIERSPMYPNYGPGGLIENETRLYDLATDPGQNIPLTDPAVEARMIEMMRSLMIATDAPAEAFGRVAI